MVLKALREPIHVVGLLPVPVRVMVKPEGGFDPLGIDLLIKGAVQRDRSVSVIPGTQSEKIGDAHRCALTGPITQC